LELRAIEIEDGKKLLRTAQGDATRLFSFRPARWWRERHVRRLEELGVRMSFRRLLRRRTKHVSSLEQERRIRSALGVKAASIELFGETLRKSGEASGSQKRKLGS
jgi:hypothetical protein